MASPTKWKIKMKPNPTCKAANKWTIFWRSVVFILGSCVGCEAQIYKCLSRRVVKDVLIQINLLVWCWLQDQSGVWSHDDGEAQDQSQTAFMYPHIATCVFGDAARDTPGWCLFMAHRRTKRLYHLEPPNGWNVSSETGCRGRLRD